MERIEEGGVVGRCRSDRLTSNIVDSVDKMWEVGGGQEGDSSMFHPHSSEKNLF